MARSNRIKCATCFWFDRAENIDGELNWGFCMANPPVWVPATEEWQRPDVKDIEWCQFHKERHVDA